MTLRTFRLGRLLKGLGLPMLLLLGAVVLQACDTTRDVVDAADPTEWFSDDDPEPPEGAPRPSKPVPGADEDYPKLATVPERPPEPEIKSRFEDLRAGLVADRQNAQYSDEVIRRAPPPEQNRAEAAMQALEQQPGEPPTANLDNTGMAGDGAAPNSGAAEKDTSVPTVAPAPSQASSATPAPAPAPGSEPAQPQPAPPEPASSSPASASQESQAAPQVAEQAPAPEPLGGSARASDEPMRPAQPPDSAAGMARSADATSPPAQQDAPQAGSERLIATIYFPGGGAGLTGHDREILRQVAQIFSQGAQTVRIIGHTSVGTEDGSQQAALVTYKASLDRASVVADALADYGVPRDALSIDARGAKQPRYDESTDAGIAANRRAEIFMSF
ncbi:OmpA family protein [Marivibrio halodurans]|uniref:OmpA family protein n=1 Tax=Marivibrio halodurans TaxID=2039722 RepID=A0A8J7RZT9_9PROT|nr:OmpA family protein [Marivibrio halodurans]MBP5856079.1 OmpA family protein [Marivibrio halodurans]